MYIQRPISPRVQKEREKYRETHPQICTERFKLVNDYYRNHRQESGMLKRAHNLKNICENIPITIHPDELIVGGQTPKFRGCALYPENSIDWLLDEVESGNIMSRVAEPYIVSDEDRDLILDQGPWWLDECQSAKTDANIPDAYLNGIEGTGFVFNGVLLFGPKGQTQVPVGHFVPGHERILEWGFGKIRAYAQNKVDRFEADGIMNDDYEKYNFYRAIVIDMDAVTIWIKRYAALAAEQATNCTDAKRAEELETMAANLYWISTEPPKTFWQATQLIYLYQNFICLDAQLHGISYGRVDQYLGSYCEADLASGAITIDEAQEIIDMFFLKVAEMNKVWAEVPSESSPGYTSGQNMTLGGVKKDGSDATNPVTYMMLQASDRLALHSPPLSLRIHPNTPDDLWMAAIETTKHVGGVPIFENDTIAIEALQKRGMDLEDARNYAIVGCVELGGNGTEWPACGGTGCESYFNIANLLMIAICDGHNPLGHKIGDEWGPRCGPATGWLSDMKSFDEVLDAFETQLRYWVRWDATLINAFETVARQNLPVISASAGIEGCLESGQDVMFGGAKYNSTGIAGVGIGNVADSLQMIKRVVFDEKVCTGEELLNALFANWEGYEELHGYIMKAPHFGNGDAEVDKYAKWASDRFAKEVNACTGPRGRFSAGMYPVTSNVGFGHMTAPTPDGRMADAPLTDGISPLQGMDKNGPLATLESVSHWDQSEFANGTLLNMKFHPSSVNTEEAKVKLRHVIEGYFEKGGMEMQINVISTETMRAAQEDPDAFKDLVVRIAGFSAYFVEMHKESQDDLISRTELSL